MDIKIWILSSAISVLCVLISLLFGFIRSIARNFLFKKWPEIISRLDKIDNIMSDINKTHALHEVEIANIKEKINDLERKFDSCINFKKTP